MLILDVNIVVVALPAIGSELDASTVQLQWVVDLYALVPAALLELKNPYGVTKAQIGTAVPLLAVNILFIWLFAF